MRTAINEKKTGPAFAIPGVTMVPFGRLKPAPYNPRKIDPRQLDALKEGIKRHGFLNPLVVRKADMEIIGGHQRYRAVREISVESASEVPDLPCIVLDVDERTAKRMNVALNKVSGEFDDKLLGELLQMLDEEKKIGEDEVLLMGFDDGDELLASMGELPRPDGDGSQPGNTQQAPSLKLDFATRELRDAVKQAIAASQKKDEPSGVALARMLGIKAPAKAKKSAKPS